MSMAPGSFWRTVLLALVLGSLAVGAGLSGSVAAQDKDPIAERQAIMKSWGRASREPGTILKGQKPFNLQAIQAALKIYAEGAKRLPGLFPDNSKTGGDTQALPKIWEEKDKFNATATQFGQDAEAKLASITDEASFKAQFPQQLGGCGNCHKQYRAAD